MKKKLLIINKAQFGYHTDYYKYCEYLKKDFSITFLCFDTGLEELVMEDIKVKYVSSQGVKTIRGIRFILMSLFVLLQHRGVVFIHYFEKCHILKKVFPRKKMILDIRTLSVSQDKLIRDAYDKQLKAGCECFDFVTVISQGVQQKLLLNEGNSRIVSLGADVISTEQKNFIKLKLLYVGTLAGRQIKDTVYGVSLFLDRHPEVQLSYEIIGDGDEFNEINEIIHEINLHNVIKMHGRIPHFKLKPFFDQANIGISYIPMTSYYEHQPPTKTYEYGLSGMVCIATNTYENSILINQESGVLCNDNPKSFAEAIEEVYCNLSKYDSQIIRKKLLKYSWSEIVEKQLRPVLMKFS